MTAEAVTVEDLEATREQIIEAIRSTPHRRRENVPVVNEATRTRLGSARHRGR